MSHEATDGKQSRVGRSLSSQCPHKKANTNNDGKIYRLNGHVDSKEEKERVRISTAAIMNGGGDASIFVLYRVVNSDDDNSSSTAFNAFCIPRSALGGGKGPSLSIIKQYVLSLPVLRRQGRFASNSSRFVLFPCSVCCAMDE
jgi:hypothetical protein